MNHDLLIFLLCLCIFVLLGILLYQQYTFRKGTQATLGEIHGKLREIIESDSQERILIFTENRELMELAAQINHLLDHLEKVAADGRRSQMASKKMLSNISHDIKTPMTVILGYLEIMILKEAPTHEMLKKVETKAQEVLRLMEKFFTLAKIESGDMDMELSKIDVCQICRESLLDFYQLLTQADMQVDIVLPDKAVYVRAHPDALQRIFCNLISNVIRYGAQGNYLGVFLRTDKNNVYLDVVDKGQGIPSNFQEHVFDRLFTMEDSPSVQGSGLGLCIAKSLALQLGGTITLDSTPHVRTTFTLKLKKYPDPLPERNL